MPRSVRGCMYFCMAEWMTPQKCVAPRSRTTATAVLSRSSPRFTVSGSSLEMSVAADSPSDAVAPSLCSSSRARVKSMGKP